MLNPFLTCGWASSPAKLAVAAAVTLAFAALAHVLRGGNRSGAVAGGIACFALFAGAGPGAFATLAALFVMTWLSTWLGYRRKQELGLAEHREGRNARQVLANLAIAGLGAFLFGATENEMRQVLANLAIAGLGAFLFGATENGAWM